MTLVLYLTGTIFNLLEKLLVWLEQLLGCRRLKRPERTFERAFGDSAGWKSRQRRRVCRLTVRLQIIDVLGQKAGEGGTRQTEGEKVTSDAQQRHGPRPESVPAYKSASWGTLSGPGLILGSVTFFSAPLRSLQAGFRPGCSGRKLQPPAMIPTLITAPDRRGT